MATKAEQNFKEAFGSELQSSPRVKRGRGRTRNLANADTAPQAETEEFAAFADREIERAEAPSAEELAQQSAQEREHKRRRVTAIAGEVMKMVSTAVSAKENSGVETRMREDLTYYYGNERIAQQVQGVVDAAQASKGKGVNSEDERLTRSTISVNITRPKVNAAFARLSDMLLPVDDRNFAIEPTPVPQLVGAAGDPEALQAGPQGTVAPARSVALQKTTIAKVAAELMQKEIDDNLTECDFNSEARKALFQAACLGTGVLKGPVAAMRIEKAWIDSGDGEWEMDIRENVVPESRFVDVFNFYPDPACNGIVRNARFIVEREEYNSRMLRQLRGQPGFITDSIDMCLSQPPGYIKRTKSEAMIVPGSYMPGDQEMYEVFHVTCEMTKGQLFDLDVAVNGYEPTYNEFGEENGRMRKPLGDEEREEPVGACVVMCNGCAIKAYLNPLKTEHGYQVFTYEAVHGQVFGLGVSFLVRSPQRVLSTAWRMVLDNAALTVGGYVVVDRTCIDPADGTWDLYGGKVFYKTKGMASHGKVEEAFKIFAMDSQIDVLLKIMEYALKFAEDETSLPALMEGNQGAAPDTVGGMTMLMNSANVVMKVLAKRYDDCITKPHINGYYDWHMLYTKKPEIKGDFNVVARGSSHLVVRDLMRQSLIGFMQYAMQPQLAIFFKTGAYMGLRRVAEANHIDPDDVLVSEDEAPDIFKQYQQAMAQAAQAKAGGDDGMGKYKVDREMDDRDRERRFQQEMKNMDYQIKMMEFAEKRNMTVDQVRAEFARTLLQQNHEDRMQGREMRMKASMGSGI